jgi:hypothetical protein
MGNTDTQETLRTRHETKTKKKTYKNIKINSTDHTKTPEVIACAR